MKGSTRTHCGAGTAALLLFLSTAPLLACRSRASAIDAGVAVEPVQDLAKVVCRDRARCDDFDSRWPYRYRDAFVGISGCVGKETVNLFGSWGEADAEPTFFEWKAPVRVGGVFPSHAFTAASLGCVTNPPNFPFPGVIMAFEPSDFEWAALAHEDVFIPLQGEATLDHEFRATATLDSRGDASALSVSVALGAPDASGIEHHALGVGDRFAWGSHGATVVRVVEPQDGVLGAIGWVEVKLSDGARDRHDR